MTTVVNTSFEYTLRLVLQNEPENISRERKIELYQDYKRKQHDIFVYNYYINNFKKVEPVTQPKKFELKKYYKEDDMIKEVDINEYIFMATDRHTDNGKKAFYKIPISEIDSLFEMLKFNNLIEFDTFWTTTGRRLVDRTIGRSLVA